MSPNCSLVFLILLSITSFSTFAHTPVPKKTACEVLEGRADRHVDKCMSSNRGYSFEEQMECIRRTPAVPEDCRPNFITTLPTAYELCILRIEGDMTTYDKQVFCERVYGN